MAQIWKDRVQQTVSGTPGTGAFTLSTASSGFQALGAADDGKTGFFTATDGTAWETFWGTYTHSGTSLARTVRIASSTGSAISFTSAAIVFLDIVSQAAQAMMLASSAVTPGGRLTLTTAVPVTTSDVTAATSIYYTPYVSNVICLWDGAIWVPTIFAEVTLALGTLTSAQMYDVFGFLSGGVLAMELLSWTNNTTRATAITVQDGRYCKSGDKTRLYLGSLRTTSATTTEDSKAKRDLWNAYNAVARPVFVTDSTATWTYSTYAWRQANNGSGNQIECAIGISGASRVDVIARHQVASDAAPAYASTGIGEDSTTAPHANAGVNWGFIASTVTSTPTVQLASSLTIAPAAGYHKYVWLEIGLGSNTQSWFGTAADTHQYSRVGLSGSIEA